MSMTTAKKLHMRGLTGCDFLKKYDEEAKRVQQELMNIDRLKWILDYCDGENGNIAGQFISRLFQLVPSSFSSLLALTARSWLLRLVPSSYFIHMALSASSFSVSFRRIE